MGNRLFRLSALGQLTRQSTDAYPISWKAQKHFHGGTGEACTLDERLFTSSSWSLFSTGCQPCTHHPPAYLVGWGPTGTINEKGTDVTEVCFTHYITCWLHSLLFHNDHINLSVIFSKNILSTILVIATYNNEMSTSVWPLQILSSVFQFIVKVSFTSMIKHVHSTLFLFL